MFLSPHAPHTRPHIRTLVSLHFFCIFCFFPNFSSPSWVCLSLLLLALSPHVSLALSEPLWWSAFFSLGLGGPGVFVGALFVGEAYPQLRAVVASVAAAMEDSSASVFVLFRAAYFGLGLDLDVIAGVWLCLSAALAIATTAVLPSKRQIQQVYVSE